MSGTFGERLTRAERRLRWFIVGWITLSTILNVINRSTLAILAPVLEQKSGLTQAALMQFSLATLKGRSLTVAGPLDKIAPGQARRPRTSSRWSCWP
jgi:hypothetical protein